MNSAHDQWQIDVDAMYADIVFMAWLKKELPHYDCVYTGNLLDRHDAFKAGRAIGEQE